MAATSSPLPAISNNFFTQTSRPQLTRAGPARSSLSSQSQSLSSAKSDLLDLISNQNRGISTQSDPQKLLQITEAIDTIEILNRDQITTSASLSGTWRLLWTTEKEQLFIIKNAGFFGTKAGDVLQVIDVEKRNLNNVITFPPDGVFFVRSDIEITSSQRVDFRFTSAVLRGKDWEFPLPPFGQGWFESVYLDEELRVVKDIRGDYLVVDHTPYSWTEYRFDSIYLDNDIRIAKDIRGDYLVVDRALYQWKE